MSKNRIKIIHPADTLNITIIIRCKTTFTSNKNNNKQLNIKLVFCLKT